MEKKEKVEKECGCKVIEAQNRGKKERTRKGKGKPPRNTNPRSRLAFFCFLGARNRDVSCHVTTAALQPVPSGSLDLIFWFVSSGRCLCSFTGHWAQIHLLFVSIMFIIFVRLWRSTCFILERENLFARIRPSPKFKSPKRHLPTRLCAPNK